MKRNLSGIIIKTDPEKIIKRNTFNYERRQDSTYFLDTKLVHDTMIDITSEKKSITFYNLMFNLKF